MQQQQQQKRRPKEQQHRASTTQRGKQTETTTSPRAPSSGSASAAEPTKSKSRRRRGKNGATDQAGVGVQSQERSSYASAVSRAQYDAMLKAASGSSSSASASTTATISTTNSASTKASTSQKMPASDDNAVSDDRTYQFPVGVCVKIFHLRPKYRDLEHWMSDPRHVLLCRQGRVFVGEGANKRVFVHEASPWANPFKLTDYSLEECLRLFKHHLDRLLANDGELRAEFMKLRYAEEVGCFCLPDAGCHRNVVLLKLKELCEEATS